MDVQLLKDWSGMLSTLLGIGAIFYTWLTAGSRANTTELASLEGEVGALSTRMTKVESDIKHMPDEKALMELKLDLSEMRGAFGRLEVSMAGVTSTVHRVEEYLLRKGTN